MIYITNNGLLIVGRNSTIDSSAFDVRQIVVCIGISVQLWIMKLIKNKLSRYYCVLNTWTNFSTSGKNILLIFNLTLNLFILKFHLYISEKTQIVQKLFFRYSQFFKYSIDTNYIYSSYWIILFPIIIWLIIQNCCGRAPFFLDDGRSLTLFFPSRGRNLDPNGKPSSSMGSGM